MKHKQKYVKILLNRQAVILFLLVVTATSAVIFMQHRQALTVADTESPFSFSGAPGWSAPQLTPKSSIPDDVTAYLVLTNDTDCSITTLHKTGTVDVTAELKKKQAFAIEVGYKLTSHSTQPLTMQTNMGTKHYKLHQYATSWDKQGGEEYGYIQLSSGYLEINGYCKTADQLPATIPALEATKFDPTN